MLREALQQYGRQPAPTLDGFIDMLADLPDDVSNLADGRRIAADLAQDLRAAMVNDPMFGGAGQPVDPGVLLTPTEGKRARVSVISMIGLQSDEQRQGFVNQLQMALFAWIKRNPAGDRPLGGAAGDGRGADPGPVPRHHGQHRAARWRSRPRPASTAWAWSSPPSRRKACTTRSRATRPPSSTGC